MLTRRLSPEKGLTRGGVSDKDAGSRKGSGLGVSHRLEKGTSDSENIGTQMRVDCEIPHRLWKKTNHYL